MKEKSKWWRKLKNIKRKRWREWRRDLRRGVFPYDRGNEPHEGVVSVSVWSLINPVSPNHWSAGFRNRRSERIVVLYRVWFRVNERKMIRLTDWAYSSVIAGPLRRNELTLVWQFAMAKTPLLFGWNLLWSSLPVNSDFQWKGISTWSPRTTELLWGVDRRNRHND